MTQITISNAILCLCTAYASFGCSMAKSTSASDPLASTPDSRNGSSVAAGAADDDPVKRCEALAISEPSAVVLSGIFMNGNNDDFATYSNAKCFMEGVSIHGIKKIIFPQLIYAKLIGVQGTAFEDLSFPQLEMAEGIEISNPSYPCTYLQQGVGIHFPKLKEVKSLTMGPIRGWDMSSGTIQVRPFEIEFPALKKIEFIKIAGDDQSDYTFVNLPKLERLESGSKVPVDLVYPDGAQVRCNDGCEILP